MIGLAHPLCCFPEFHGISYEVFRLSTLVKGRASTHLVRPPTILGATPEYDRDE